jgi:hypothetical protein
MRSLLLLILTTCVIGCTAEERSYFGFWSNTTVRNALSKFAIRELLDSDRVSKAQPPTWYINDWDRPPRFGDPAYWMNATELEIDAHQWTIVRRILSKDTMWYVDIHDVIRGTYK